MKNDSLAKRVIKECSVTYTSLFYRIISVCQLLVVQVKKLKVCFAFNKNSLFTPVLLADEKKE